MFWLIVDSPQMWTEENELRKKIFLLKVIIPKYYIIATF